MNNVIKKKTKKSKKGNKTKTNRKLSTISGLPNSALITNIISAFVGIFIFVVAPYAVNKLNNPTLSALINVFPTGVLVALFISEEEFTPFYTKLLFAPIFNVVVNWIVYFFLVYLNWSALSCILLNIGIWSVACILAYLL